MEDKWFTTSAKWRGLMTEHFEDAALIRKQYKQFEQLPIMFSCLDRDVPVGQLDASLLQTQQSFSPEYMEIEARIDMFVLSGAFTRLYMKERHISDETVYRDFVIELSYKRHLREPVLRECRCLIVLKTEKRPPKSVRVVTFFHAKTL